MRLNLQLLDSYDPKVITGWIRDFVYTTRKIIDAHLGFGDGVNADNIFGAWFTYTSNATPNTQDTITHNLGFIPVGFIVVVKDKAGDFYKGSTTWTTSSIFLKCSVASVTATIFVIGPSNQSF